MRIFRRSKSQPNLLESLLILFLSTTCAGTETTTCSTGLVCPTGKMCVNDGKECAMASCGNGLVEKEFGETCDDGPNNQPALGATCSAKCEKPKCGNGEIEFNEVCDPNANDAGRACQNDCKYLAECGNGTWDETMGEKCDGRDLPPDSGLLPCSAECELVFCGNGVVEPVEKCDPKDPEGAPCNDDCSLSVCGDGKKGPIEFEYCDPGMDPECEEDCQRRKNCGNGSVDDGEECDPKSEDSSPELCTPTCKLRGCGNGFIDQIGELDEACDDGNTVAGDGCSANCKSEEVCGNNIVDRGFEAGEKDLRWELCDDGNQEDGDLCSKDCRVSTACGNNKVDRGEDCDNGEGAQEGRTVETAECNVDCRAPLCGDGIINRAAGETCDKSTPADAKDCNGASASSLNLACKAPTCGDNYINTFAGEECEPDEMDMDKESGDTAVCNGNQAPDAAKCHRPQCGDGYVNEEAAEECEPSVEDGFNKGTKDSPTCNGNSEATPEGARCKKATCGDDYTNHAAGEACDDGPETAACNRSPAAAAAGVDCQTARCGDGYVNTAAGEECEPGLNGEPVNEVGDSTTCNGPGGGASECKIARCGDGYTNLAADECGDAPGDSAMCNSNLAGAGVACKAKQCGDGYEHKDEDCDSSGRDTDTCNGRTCTTSKCGDGYVNANSEQCEPGAQGEPVSSSGDSEKCNGPKGNDAACKPPSCGDGYANGAAHECGDQSFDTDTCNSNLAGAVGCLPRKCGDGYPHKKEECESNGTDTPGCNGLTCTIPACGDHYFNQKAEDCEPGANEDPVDDAGDSAECNGPNAQDKNAACRKPSCGDGYVNEAARECGDQTADTANCNSNQAGGEAACRQSSCGDGYTNQLAGELCDAQGIDSQVCDGLTCLSPACGDGHVNVAAGEACDPGAESDIPNEAGDTAHCNGPLAGNVACQEPNCGDGYTNLVAFTGTNAVGEPATETCDTGTNDSGGCNGANGTASNCQTPDCGDARVNTAANEECDPHPDSDLETWKRTTQDRKNAPPDRASCYPSGSAELTCKRSVCGDGYKGPDEVCDPTDELDPDHLNCNPPNAGELACKLGTCGDGAVTGDEECDGGDKNDDGVPDDTPSCNGGTSSLACKDAACGDGYLNNAERWINFMQRWVRVEECDHAELPTLTCNENCRAVSCGDARVDVYGGEECDPAAGMPCMPSCTLIDCGNGRHDYFTPDAWNAAWGPTPTPEPCERGTEWTGDGEPKNTSALCTTFCTLSTCGDGIVNADANEECEPPDSLHCDPTCRSR